MICPYIDCPPPLDLEAAPEGWQNIFKFGLRRCCISNRLANFWQVKDTVAIFS